MFFSPRGAKLGIKEVFFYSQSNHGIGGNSIVR
jgi:hypothetical protein